MEVEIKWWMAALAGMILALVPSLFLWGKVRPRNKNPELLKIAKLSKALSRGRGPLTYSQVRKIEKADPWVVYRVLLKDYDFWTPERQIAITCCLARNGYVEQSIKMLKSSNPVERVQGAELLGFLQSQSGVAPLLEALGDPQDEVRLVTATALKRMNDLNIVLPLIKSLEPPVKATPARVAEILFALGPPVVEPILRAMDGVTEPTRGVLISILGEIGGAGITDELFRALQDRAPHIRGRAAEALGRIGGQEAGTRLIPLLTDSSAEVRARAAQALGEMGCQEALPALQELKQRDEEWKVRASASHAIREMSGRTRKND
ncbi:MAG: HEAT repeat domain-containing protein [Firmicutes bacterium]|nr:HEAT repeat domain-containing protein [Bacillota bacterium]